MVERIHSRKVILVSMCVHMLVLIAIGWMAAGVFAVHDTPEKYIELELANEAAEQIQKDNIASGRRMPDASPAAPFAPKANEQTITKESPSHGQVSTGDLAILPSGDGDGPGNIPGQDGNGKDGDGTDKGMGKTFGGGNQQAVKHSGGMIAPSVARQIKPDYPENAKQAGHEGTVFLKIQVLESGRAGNISVTQTSGFGELDAAAIDSIRRWRFNPARERDSGQAVVCYINLSFNFDLTNQ